jgi:anthranilate phosphoribosyltransferase
LLIFFLIFNEPIFCYIFAAIMDSLIHHLENKQELSAREIETAAEFLLDNHAPAEKKAHLLEALAKKGETAAEITGFVETFLAHAVNPHIHLLDLEGPTIDLCGTGGDHLNLFNVSTTTMFIVAAAGAVVVKHGNRGITSKSGGADVLEALGVRLDLSTEEFRDCLENVGAGFLFAPAYHPAFKAVAEARKLLGQRKIRTIFNLIGPLLNPARPECQLVGVFSRDLCPVFADILQRLGRDSAWVVNGSTAEGQSVDEVSLMGSTRICKAGSYQDQEDEEISPTDFGLRIATVSELQGGDAQENALILENILSGKETGPKRDIVLLNAATALACCGLSDHIGDGLDIARAALDDGSALEKLRLLQKHAR